MASYNAQLKNGPGDDIYPIVRNVRAEMPPASFDLIDDFVIYVGPTTTEYVNGHRYQCVQNGSVYSWVDVTGENNTPVSGGNVNAFDGDLYTVRLSDGALTTVNFMPIRYSGDKDFNFGMKVTQATNTGAIAITCNNKAVWWSDGNLPPQFDEGNQAPAVSLPETTYMLRFHWDCDANALMGNAEYLYPAYGEMSPVYGSRGVFVTTPPAFSAMIVSGGTYGGGVNTLVYNHGLITDVVMSGAGLHVSSGGLADGITMTNYCYMAVSSGGFAKNIVNNSGNLTVISGGFVDGVTLTRSDGIAGGTLHLNVNGGYAQNVHVEQYGAMMVRYAGGYAYNTQVDSGGTMHVIPPAIARGTTVTEGGLLNVSSGGTIQDTTVTGLGSVCLFGYAKAESLNVNGGTIYTYAGCQISSLAVDSTGRCTIGDGTEVDGVVLHGSECSLVNYGSIVDMTLNTQESTGVAVNNRGPLTGLTILNGGLRTSSGCVVTSAFISGGNLSVYPEGSATDILLYSGGALTARGEVTHTYMSGGSLTISSGGYINDTTIASAGEMTIKSSGVASDTYVSSTGYLLVGQSGHALYTDVLSNGSAYVNATGSAYDIVVSSGGSLTISANGIAQNVTSEVGAVINVLTGGTITYAPISAGVRGVFLSSGSTRTSSAMSMSGTVMGTGLSATSVRVYSRGKIIDTVLSSGGRADISSGGVGIDPLIYSGGNYIISSGGVMSGGVNSGGMITIAQGATGYNQIGISYYIIVNGTAYNTVGSGGYVIARGSGAVIYNPYLPPGPAGLFADGNGGVISGAYCDGGAIHAGLNGGYGYYYDTVINASNTTFVARFSGSVVYRTTISQGSMQMYSGGVASDTLLLPGTRMSAYNTGSAYGVVNSNASVYISSGALGPGYISGLSQIGTWDGPKTYTYAGCLVEDAHISAGYMYVYTNSVASNAHVYGPATYDSRAYQIRVSSDGLLSSGVAHENGIILVYSAGVGSNLTISSGGRLEVQNGGSALDVVSMTSAIIVSSAGATITYAPYKRRLAALKSTGTQWIDTGITFETDKKLEVQANVTNLNADRAMIIGCHTGTGTNPTFNLEFFTGHYPRLYLYLNGKAYETSELAVQEGKQIKVTGTYDIANTASILTVDGVSYQKTIPAVAAVTSPINLRLFADNRTTGVTMHPLQIHAVKIYKAGTLVRSFIPVIDNNDVACMFDEVSRTFFYNQGTGNFAFIELDEPEITRVSYLEAAGAQYIDTTILPRNYKVFKVEAGLTPTTLGKETYWGENFGYWFGTNTSNQWTIGGGTATAVNTVTSAYHDVELLTTATSLTDPDCTITITVDGTLTKSRTMTGTRLSKTGSYWVAGLNDGNSGLSGVYAKIHYQRLYGDGTLVADMVPALDASNVPCMYDKVRKQYFYNAGTGSFAW